MDWGEGCRDKRVTSMSRMHDGQCKLAIKMVVMTCRELLAVGKQFVVWTWVFIESSIMMGGNITAARIGQWFRVNKDRLD